jgi:hypothetical protein
MGKTKASATTAMMEELTSEGKVIYGEKWVPVGSPARMRVGSDIARGVVTESENPDIHSLSVCFFLKQGGHFYQGLSNQSTLDVGDEIDLNTIVGQKLERNGEHILRIDAKPL